MFQTIKTFAWIDGNVLLLLQNLGNKSCAHLASVDNVAVDLVLIFDFSIDKSFDK